MRAAERPRVLIAGGGVAALEAALSLEEITEVPLNLTLLTSTSRFEYSPLSVAEPFGLGRAHRFELADLLRNRAVQPIVDTLEVVDAQRGEIRTSSRTFGYDALLVAVGALKREALPGALTFSGSKTTDDLRRLLREAEAGRLRHLVIAVPSGVAWALPAYELALMASAQFDERGIPTEVALVTPEPTPVAPFGRLAGKAVEEMLRLRRIAFHSAVPLRAEPGRLLIEAGEDIVADAVVALPELTPHRISGLPQDELGFIPVDEYGRVKGLAGVYAAGDTTNFPLKQGGLAAQQADVAAEAIAADLGQSIEPQPFRPVLRGLLLTGRAPRYLRAEVVRGRVTRSSAREEPTWWPPTKIAGRRLGPFLALHGAPGGAPPDAVALELEAPAPPQTNGP
ncbi:MAG: FAD-dependent oxidoreductase [Solirubrobacterales bacterium]